MSGASELGERQVGAGRCLSYFDAMKQNRFTWARFTWAVVCAAALFMLAGPARADEPKASPLRAPLPLSEPVSPPAKPAGVSVLSWGADNALCAEWTNSCVVCQRNEVGVSACSTPGIACQPKDIICRRQIAKKP